jgi:hypothetical protein
MLLFQTISKIADRESTNSFTSIINLDLDLYIEALM